MSIDTDYEILRRVFTEYAPTGWAIEFGVYSGYSLGIIAAHMPVIGLDSFEGLPEDWREGFPKGTFGPPSDEPLLEGPTRFNMMMVKGWFENTVPMLRDWGLPRLGLVHIDCDLYSSTVTALNGIIDFIGPDTIIVFDEYQGYDGCEEHESRAWMEFCSRNLVTAERILTGDQEVAFMIHDIGARRG